MEYPKNLLSDDETILLDLRPHLLSLLPALAWALLIIAVVITSCLLGALLFPPVIIAISVAAVIALVFLSVIPFLRWSNTQFVLTSERVISREGILAKSALEIPLHRINDVGFKQTIFERMLGTGNLTIESAGEHGMNRFLFIRRPEKVQNEIYKAMEACEKRIRGGVSAPAEDIPAQIEKLASLRDKGIVTAEEFDRKKKELLDRM
ncbi:MAG: PH domain-containing protein [Candidatus Xenobiia bacterium LiM19]